MFKPLSLLCASTLVLRFASSFADHPGDVSDRSFDSVFTDPSSPFTEPSDLPSLEHNLREPENFEKPVVRRVNPVSSVKPFTGRIKKPKVRMRLQPDVESTVVKELDKGALLSVVGESDDFYAVEAPRDFKAYIFRSFVLDGQVEGNRVNVRLEPNTESPVLTHLNAGDPVDGEVCPSAVKWLEISPPSSVRFYVAKNYVENFGGPEKKMLHEERLRVATEETVAAEQFAESEMLKEFPGIDLDKITHKFQTIIQDYTDFPHLTERAQEGLAKAQERFLDQRIAYLETKGYEEDSKTFTSRSGSGSQPTDKMKLWQPVEDALYLSWVTFNDTREMSEYYEDQKLSAQKITGILEPYLAPVKCKPGDYFIKQDGLPLGYLYSTKVNLQEFVGKKITCIGTPRPNNHFAFPAFFVLEVEE